MLNIKYWVSCKIGTKERTAFRPRVGPSRRRPRQGSGRQAAEILYVHTRPPLFPLPLLTVLPGRRYRESESLPPSLPEYRLFTLNFVRFSRPPRSDYDMRYSLAREGQRERERERFSFYDCRPCSQKSTAAALPIHSPWT